MKKLGARASVEAEKEFGKFLKKVQKYLKDEMVKFNLEEDEDKEILLREFDDAITDIHRLTNRYPA